MKRHIITPRPDWKEKADSIGFNYYNDQNTGYGTNWNESICYEFTTEEVDILEEATEKLHSMCLEAVEYVTTNRNLMTKFSIKPEFHDYIIRSWQNREPSLYGRFDLSYDGKSAPKMLEYNADTPTLVIETALMQWFWLQDNDVYKDYDQFNSLHEKLLDNFKYIKSFLPAGETFYFIGYEDLLEEYQTLQYFIDLATQSELKCKFLNISDLGSDGRYLYDKEDNHVRFFFKLYPWEWMYEEEVSKTLLNNRFGILEPAWKCILSNKAILPVLWEMFPNSELLLPSTWKDTEQPTNNFVIKPMLSREGANIDFIENGVLTHSTDGCYTGPRIYQQKANLFADNGNYAVIGSWIVGDKSAGIVIRDSPDPIVKNMSYVVPHYFI